MVAAGSGPIVRWLVPSQLILCTGARHDGSRVERTHMHDEALSIALMYVYAIRERHTMRDSFWEQRTTKALSEEVPILKVAF